jgi:NAD(P)-dependent dehydrogenase (short-subunit alcohol dehydrogenase family)
VNADQSHGDNPPQNRPHQPKGIYDLSGTTVVVTGGNDGIGAAWPEVWGLPGPRWRSGRETMIATGRRWLRYVPRASTRGRWRVMWRSKPLGRFLSACSLGRMASQREIDAVVVFWPARRPAITGSTIAVDGGTSGH